MQPDRRLVEHVQHAGQARADLRRETDALALTARQRARAAREREIIEADIVEELQPVAYLLEDARRDLGLLRRECLRQFLEPHISHADRLRRHFADVLSPDLHRERLRLEAIAPARRARMRALVARQFLAHPVAIGLTPAPLDVGDHPLERLHRFVGAQAVLVGERDLLAIGAEQDRVLDLTRQLLPRRRHVDLVVLRERAQRLLVVGRRIARARPRPDRAIAKRDRPVRHHEIGLEFQLGAEAVAGRAGTCWCVEREQPRLDFLDREARHRTREALREHDPLVRVVLRLIGAFGVGLRERLIGELDQCDAIRQRQRRFETVGKPCRDILAHDEAIHDDIDVVLVFLVELRCVGNLVERAVDLDPLKALLLPLRELFAPLALAPAHDGSQ